MEFDPRRRTDGFLSLERGMDSGKSPSAIQRNQYAFGCNVTARGGFATCRPGYNRLMLSLSDGVDFKDNLFQRAGYYQPMVGAACLVALIGGHLYRFNVDAGNLVQDISIPGDYNANNLEMAWMTQAEDFLIVQDNQMKALIYDGASTRRAKGDEVPVGNVITYGMGRVWTAMQDGKSFVGGDLVYSSSGTGTYNRRDAVLKFTENTFLNEGGAFTVPNNSGRINAMRFISNLDTSLGQGPLQVFTQSAAFSVNAPFDRTTWKDLQYPIQTISLEVYGATGQDNTITINGDLWYRSFDGVRSFIVARRDFGTWGNVPMSSEMDRVLNFDDQSLLRFGSAVVFDNRLLMTTSPMRVQGHGVAHRGLVVVDFDLISSMGQRSDPAWDGLWTGVRILQIVKGRFSSGERCFAFVLNADNEIELWEISKTDRFDNGTGRIQWFIETPSYGFNTPYELKRLSTGDLFVDRLAGQVDFDIKFKPNQHPAWIAWDTWNECAKFEDCGDDTARCPVPREYREQYRSKKRFVTPTDDCDPLTSTPYRNGYEFQSLITVTGYARIKQMRLHADWQEESSVGECKTGEAVCDGIATCDPDIFAYTSS